MASSTSCQRRRRLGVAGTALALGLATGSLADDLPDAEFLEYLGSWGDEGDESDWIMVAGEEDGDPAELARLREASGESGDADEEVMSYER